MVQGLINKYSQLWIYFKCVLWGLVYSTRWYLYKIQSDDRLVLTLIFKLLIDYPWKTLFFILRWSWRTFVLYMIITYLIVGLFFEFSWCLLLFHTYVNRSDSTFIAHLFTSDHGYQKITGLYEGKCIKKCAGC